MCAVLSLAFASARACTHVRVCLYRGVGTFSSEGCQHRCRPTGEAKAAAGTHWKYPWWHLGFLPHGLSAPPHSLAQARSLTLCSAHKFMQTHSLPLITHTKKLQAKTPSELSPSQYQISLWISPKNSLTQLNNKLLAAK